MKRFSKKLNVQLIAEVFKEFGIEHIVLSPGSRNGALATHFSHHPAFKTYSIVDERSAGFVALGMAQQLRKPVVVCSTSGSAVANYYPAVTEAFYQNIPLIVLTADRPEHLIDNFDGQTIRQKDFFQQHSYFNSQIPEDETTEGLTQNLQRIKNSVQACFQNSGPVHINMPFDEPLYDFSEEIGIQFDKIKKNLEKPINNKFDYEELAKKWSNSGKKFVLVGLQYPDEELNRLMTKLGEDDSVVIFTETTSNLHSSRFFNKIDSVIYSLNESELEDLKPKILLTVGQNVVSKKIKVFLRNHPPKEHWHLDEHWFPDTFQCLTQKIESAPLPFLKEFLPEIQKVDSDYFSRWNTIRKEKEKKQKEFAKNAKYSDFKVFETLIHSYPKELQIQYGNSSVIRYAQLFDHNSNNEVFCNRGTSGIDGITSTAAGASMVNGKQTLLITGDIALFYDSNGLWNPYLTNNLLIIVINNGGGNIFKIIPGPENSEVVEKVFETRHHLSIKYLAEMYDFEYSIVYNLKDLKEIMKNFYIPGNRPKILEINTSEIQNEKVMRDYFKIS